MNHHTDPTNQKAPGATNTKGSGTDSASDFDFATEARRSKAIATQVAEFALRGHAVHPLVDGEFLVCKYGHTFHAVDFAALQNIACRLGVSQ